jgi:calcium/calmodulin-dependent protein kinase (CaM kinase) II
MNEQLQQELLDLNLQLLQAIVTADWKTYEELCDPTLTAFEPEACGQLVEGMPFHRFYFDLGAAKGARSVTMASPHVRVIGDCAIVCYVRLNQKLDAAGAPVTNAVEETRVWQKKGNKWRHVHFHRSPVK